MRRHKQTLIENAIVAGVGADFGAEPRHGQPLRYAFNKRTLTCHISTGRSKSAAGILNQRTCHNISAVSRGFVDFAEFAITVINSNDDARETLVYERKGLLQLVLPERLTPCIPARALEIYNFDAPVQTGFERVQINLSAILQLNLPEMHTLPFKGMRRVCSDSDRFLQRIIGLTGGGKNHVAQLRYAGKHGKERMCPINKLGTYKRGICLEGISEDNIQRITPNVFISIAGRRGEVTRSNGRGLKGG